MATTTDNSTPAPAPASMTPDDKPSSYAYKVPTGGGRDRNAPCNWLGPWMATEMKGRSISDLKRVPAESIRDGSLPMTSDVEEHDEDFKDEAHVAEKIPELAHINNPKENEVIEDRFLLHFVDPKTYDKKIRLLFFAGESTEEPKATIDLETFGNQYKKKVDRPAGLPAGAYTLAVQMLEKDDFVEKASVHVELA